MENPSVQAIMVTGGDSARRPLAKYIANLFYFQSYKNAELLILNQGDRLFDKTPERIREVLDGEGLSVGALRNLAWKYVEGDVMLVWDDDDYRGFNFIETLVSSYAGTPVTITEEIFLDLKSLDAFCVWNKRGWENSLLFPKGVKSRYSGVRRGSDTSFRSKLVKEYGGVNSIENIGLGEYYVRTYHGRNVWNRSHFTKKPFAKARKFPHRYATKPLTPSQRQIVYDVVEDLEQQGAKI